MPRPATPPPRPARPAADWRDAAATPGDWSYSAGERGSVASFGSGLFSVQCNPGKTGVSLIRSGVGVSGPVGMSITTSAGTRALNASATPRGAVVTLQPRDAVLDAMAFSRGRFAVAMTGQPTLYVPSWTEISRVIEDCR
ncbi:hypothetical protein GGR40_001018 [Novosphingobium gossypii]